MEEFVGRLSQFMLIVFFDMRLQGYSGLWFITMDQSVHIKEIFNSQFLLL